MLNWNISSVARETISLNGQRSAKGPIIDVLNSSRLWNTGHRAVRRANLDGRLSGLSGSDPTTSGHRALASVRRATSASSASMRSLRLTQSATTDRSNCVTDGGGTVCGVVMLLSVDANLLPMHSHSLGATCS